MQKWLHWFHINSVQSLQTVARCVCLLISKLPKLDNVIFFEYIFFTKIHNTLHQDDQGHNMPGFQSGSFDYLLCILIDISAFKAFTLTDKHEFMKSEAIHFGY